MRASTLALLAFSACRFAEAPAEAPDTPAPVAEMRASVDTTQTRAQAAGLSGAQAAELERLGVPIYVPVLPDGWTLTEQTSDAPVYGGRVYPDYTLQYRAPDGACLAVAGASEGLGGVFVDEPPAVREVDVPRVATSEKAILGVSTPGDRTEGWENGRVATDWFQADGLALTVYSIPDCLAPDADIAEAFLVSLHPLDPADDVIVLGPLDYATAFGDDALPSGPDPEALALAVFGPQEEGEGRQRTRVETLRRRPTFAVVLVTTTDLADDSVRDERVRAVLMRTGQEWEITSFGRQRRCQAGRGAQTWSASACA